MKASDWPEVRLGQVARMRSGGTPPTSVSGYYGGGIPWASISDMSSTGKYLHHTERTLTQAGLANSAAVLFPPNVLLFAMYASIGECCVSLQPIATSQAILGIECSNKLNVEYLYYVMQHRRAAIARSGQQGTQANLNAQMVRDTLIALPERDEQDAIAGVLSDTDSAIAALDALIAKKRDLKQGAMQRLIPESSRCLRVGTPVAVGKSSLDEFAELRPGVYLPAGDYKDGPIEVQGAGARMGWHSSPTERSACSIIGRVGTVGKPRFMANGCWVNNNAAAIVAKTAKADPRYVQLLLERLEWAGVVSSTAQPFLMASDLMSAVCELPNLEEQGQVSSTLFAMEAEIEALHTQRNKMGLIKQGMMQELLSGRVRLK